MSSCTARSFPPGKEPAPPLPNTSRSSTIGSGSTRRSATRHPPKSPTSIGKTPHSQHKSDNVTVRKKEIPSDAGSAFGLPGGSVEDLIAILASLQDQLDDLTATVRRQQQAIAQFSAAVPVERR